MSTKEKKRKQVVVQGHTEHLYNLYKHNRSNMYHFYRDHLFTPEIECRYTDSIHCTSDLLHIKTK